MTDPRPANKYNEMYTVDYLGNVVGGRPVLYNNQPVELLMDMVAASIKKGEPIWFGCEVSKRFAVKLGIEDLTMYVLFSLLRWWWFNLTRRLIMFFCSVWPVMTFS